jgi:kynurenine formamidase
MRLLIDNSTQVYIFHKIIGLHDLPQQFPTLAPWPIKHTPNIQ